MEESLARFYRAELGFLCLQRAREKFVCHTVPVTILKAALIQKQLWAEHGEANTSNAQQRLADSSMCHNQGVCIRFYLQKDVRAL